MDRASVDHSPKQSNIFLGKFEIAGVFFATGPCYGSNYRIIRISGVRIKQQKTYDFLDID